VNRYRKWEKARDDLLRDEARDARERDARIDWEMTQRRGGGERPVSYGTSISELERRGRHMRNQRAKLMLARTEPESPNE